MKEELAAEIENLLLEFRLPAYNVDFRPIPFPGSWGFAFAGTFAIAGALLKAIEDTKAACPIYDRLFPPGEKPNVKAAASKLAELLAGRIQGGPLIERAEEENGYLNLYLKPQPYAKGLLNRILEKPEKWSKGKRRREQVMVEYSQPNTHKRFHVGHLRNACLGATVIRAMRHAGFPVIAANYYGDIGAHVIKCLWGLRRFHSDPAQWPSEIHTMANFLGEVYSDADEKLSESEKLKTEAMELIRAVLQKNSPLVPEPFAENLAIEVRGYLDHYDIEFLDTLGRQQYIDNIRRTLAVMRDAAEGLHRSGDDGPLTPFIKAIQKYLRFEREVFDYEESYLNVAHLWEESNQELHRLWRRTRQVSLDDFHRIYEELDCPFDVEFYESEVENEGKEMVAELLERGIAYISQGAAVMDLDALSGSKEGTYRILLLLRSDGSSLYSTKEIALARRKFQEFELDKSIYIVGVDQSFYFKQLFKALELIGFEKASRCTHIPYGMVSLPEGKMASRKGNVIPYDDLIARLKEEAGKVLIEKRPDLPDDERNEIARMVAYGALKYSMLMVENVKPIVFDWDRALDFDGRAAPYLQYAHARTCRILEEGGVPETIDIPPTLELTEHEVELLKKIEELPLVVERCADECQAHYLANYSFELCQVFSDFYTNCPVLKSDEPLRTIRLALCAAFKSTLASALEILGIESPDRM